MKCKIETLTPCHIGSGGRLIKDIDFVTNDGRIGIVSPEKIYTLLGDGGIDMWCNAIERRDSIWDVIKTRQPNACLEDACSRTMDTYGAICNELGEQVASNGVPYIPGSSIKGAIVSAIVGECRQDIKLPSNIRNKNNNIAEQLLVKPTEKKGKIVYDPTNSNLRFLRVGDAYFDGAATIAIQSISLNLRERESIIDDKATMLVECIDKDCETTFDLQLLSDYHAKCGNEVPPLLKALQSESHLFHTMNSHTRRLLDEEKAFWREQKDRKYYHIDTDREQEELDDYIDYVDAVIDHCKCCANGKEAILRIGYGSGWKFMTGGWFEKDNGRWDDIVDITRPKNEEKYYQYDFPKTRRIGYSPFGFVKISRLG